MQTILANASKNMFSSGQISNFFLRSNFQTNKDRGWWKHDWKIRWTKIGFAILSHKKRSHALDLPLRPVIDSRKKMRMSSWWWLTSQHPVRSISQKCRPGTWDDSVLADELDDLEDASTASTTVSCSPEWEPGDGKLTVEILEDIHGR